jgi:hypothetical protein
MVPSSITLHSASSRITARLAGTCLTSFFRQPSGRAIPTGNYIISAPMHNSVYGTFALLSPVRGAAGLGMDWIMIRVKPQAGKGQVNLQADWVTIDPPLLANRPGVFVLVEKLLAGRNAIVVTGGFAELMGALQQAGGATVTVA